MLQRWRVATANSLGLNLHFHIIHVDGVFDRGADEALRFFDAMPTTEDIEELVVELGLACERWLGKQFLRRLPGGLGGLLGRSPCRRRRGRRRQHEEPDGPRAEQVSRPSRFNR